MSSSMFRRVVVASIPLVLAAGLNPVAALADDAARISRLESEIQLLRTRIDEQHRRILRLEDELRRRTGDPLIGTIPGRHADEAPTIATDSLPWHSSDSWKQVVKGMSESDVTNVLGRPTSIESFGSHKTLFYRGAIEGVGIVSGHVNFRDDRVVAVNQPEFGS